MEITLYRSHTCHTGSNADTFSDRNPNISYIVSSGLECATCILIDANGELDSIFYNLAQKRLKLDCVLITHNHQDHTCLLPELVKKLPDIRIGIHPSSLNALSSLGFDRLFPLENDAVIRLGSETLSIVHTPGHTWDSVSFCDKRNNLFFSGDTILGGGIGCCDYNNGGNRNTFYWTIRNLLKTLPHHTRIYPGHYSEHYQTLPPYNLSTETTKNPYILNTLQGKRGDFDRDLKAFSSEYEIHDYTMMHESDLDEIWALEREIWIPELQASREIIQTRLRRGHKILAMKRHNKLLGMICWCYSKFSILDHAEQFPRKFGEFSACGSCSKINAQSAFIYSVGVRPANRKKGIGSLLLQWAVEKIRDDDIYQLFVDSRLPSYNGSHQSDQETIQQDFGFREVIDQYFANNRFPSDHEFAADPRIRFYIRNGLKPWLILKDFIQDKASGNMRVICYMNLEQEQKGE